LRRRVLAALHPADAPDLDFSSLVGWNHTGTWSISGSKAINTPVPGAEVIVNGTFASDTVWTKGGGWTIGSGVATRGNNASSSNITPDVLTNHTWYRCSFDHGSVSNGAFRPLYQTDLTEAGVTGSGTAALSSFLARGGTTAGIRATAGNMSGTVDNVSYKPLNMASLILTQNFGVTDANIEVEVTMPSAGTHAVGVIACLDNASNPMNYLLCWMVRGGANCQIFRAKCVAGVYTEFIAQGATYADGNTIGINKVGTTVEYMYDGAQIGLDATVDDSTVINNTVFGVFSTHPDNTLDNFAITPV
jgi:hypothetical protein